MYIEMLQLNWIHKCLIKQQICKRIQKLITHIKEDPQLTMSNYEVNLFLAELYTEI